MRSAVGRWYTGKTPRDLAYQVTKYQARDGWSHRDALRLAHPKAPNATHDLLFRYAVKGWDGLAERRDGAEADVVERAAVLHVTGITLALSDTARATVAAVLDRAEGAGTRISFDVNHRAKLIDEPAARACYREVAARADVVFAGDDEARIVLGRSERPDDEAELAHDLAAVARGRAVVKLGSRGAVASIDGVLLRRHATPVTVVDPVGAGDAFVAAWLAAELDGAGPRAALDRAADAGALACTVEGDWHEADPGALTAALPHEPVDHAVHDRVDR